MREFTIHIGWKPDGNPLPFKPLAFQKLFLESCNRLRVLAGGYGSSKTATGCVDFVTKGLQYPRSVLVDVSLNFPMARKNVIPIYNNIIESSSLNSYITFNKSEWAYHFRNGSVLWLCSADNPQRISGITANHIRLDEFCLMPISIIPIVKSRLRASAGSRGLVLTGTPEAGIGSDWYNFIYGLGPGHQPEDEMSLSDDDKFILNIETRDNTYLPEDFIQDLYNSYDPEMQEIFLRGNFTNLYHNNACYNFDLHRHTGETCYDRWKTLYLSYDFNIENYSVSVWQYDEELKRAWNIDEIYLQRANTERMTREIARKYADHLGNVIVTGDPSGSAIHTDNPLGEFSNYDQIRSILHEKFPARSVHISKPAPIPIDASVNYLNSLFYQGKIIIDKANKRVIRDLQEVRRLPDGGIDKSDDTLTHFFDGVRYFAWHIIKGSRYHFE